MGRANMPTPPNSTTNIQPKNDKIAIMYTANELSNSNIESAEADLVSSPL